MNNGAQRLTSGRVLAHNAAWNLLGTVVPLGIATFAIPVLIRGLGTQRFGLLSLIWVAIGYFSVFDLGLSRALTKLVSERLGEGKDKVIPELVMTALAMMGILGIIAAAIVAFISPWLVGTVLKTPMPLKAEGERAFWILSLSLPFIIISGGMVGLLEAHQHFREISIIRLVSGALIFLGPLIVLHWTPDLTAAAATLAASRILAAAAYALLCRYTFPHLWCNGGFRASLLRPLVSFGGWFTISNVVGPLMVYFDRFVIGAVVSLTAVAYYTTPYEVVTRLWVLPAALVGVLFPAFTAALVADEAHVEILFRRACRIIILSMFPLIGLAILFAPECMSAWLGPAFSQHSVTVLRWLAVGVLINSLARLPHALVQSAGRPDLIAKLHFFELPVYLAGLWFLLHAFGIGGAAIAWTIRIAVDMLAFFCLGAKLVPAVKMTSIRAVSTMAAACLGVGPLILVSALPVKIGLALGLILIAMALTFREARVMGWRQHVACAWSKE